MDDSTIPFDFDDCNAFLNSLDDNTSASTVKYQKGFNQATTMNDGVHCIVRPCLKKCKFKRAAI